MEAVSDSPRNPAPSNIVVSSEIELIYLQNINNANKVMETGEGKQYAEQIRSAFSFNILLPSSPYLRFAENMVPSLSVPNSNED